MNATERAEKILDDQDRHHDQLCEVGKTITGVCGCSVRWVAAELEAYAAERVEERKGSSFAANPKEWFCLDCRPLIDSAIRQAVEEDQAARRDLRDHDYQTGKAEAYADAAKIANKYADSTGSQIYEEIRALARAPEGDSVSEWKGVCTLCGHALPPGEEMFKYHGFSDSCPSKGVSSGKPSEVKKAGDDEDFQDPTILGA